MRKFLGLTRRNLLVYFKDGQSVFFSMLTPLIVFVLYILFLGDTFVSAIETAVEPVMDFVSDGKIRTLANGLLLCGILGSSMITVPYNSLITVVRDREQKIDSDICATPVKREQIVLSYFTASAVSAFVMSAVILTLGLVILGAAGEMGEYLGISDILKMYGVTALGAVSATAILLVAVMFIKTASASGAFMGIISAATGFFIGAYIPLSEFSSGVQTVCNLIPGCGITSLYRDALLSPVLDRINDSIGGIDGGGFEQEIKGVFTFSQMLFDHTLTSVQTVLYILAATLIAAIALIIIYPKVYKRK